MTARLLTACLFYVMQHLESADIHQLQALHYASSLGQEKLVSELLCKGMDVDAVGGKLRHTPLMLGTDIMVGYRVFT